MKCKWIKMNKWENKSYIFSCIENRLVKSESIFLFKEINQIKMIWKIIKITKII
jgi:hypothetical protein